LLRKDPQFATAVFVYSVSKPNDPKRAKELDSLAAKIGQWKDDPAPEVPIPPGAFVEADPEAADTPAKPGAAATPAANAPGRSGTSLRAAGGRFGRIGGGGK
jgi:hypothetical protein